MTLSRLFDARVRASPDAEAYIQYDSAAGAWRTWTWRAVGDEKERWKRALDAEHIPPGERVALMLANSVEWICCEQAALALGLVVVPLYCTDSPGNSAYVLADSGARLLLVGNAGQWEQLKPHRALFPALKTILSLAPPTDQNDVRFCGDWLEASAAGHEPGSHAANPQDLATLVYTSGTTGRPKGVMLSHGNILSNVRAILEVVPVHGSDRFLSFLPLSHAFERTVGYYLPLMAGACVAFNRSLQTLAEDMTAVAPTALVSVPRIYEKMFVRIENNVAGGPRWRQALFHRAEAAGWRRFVGNQPWGGRASLLARLEWDLLGGRVSRPVAERLGGRLRVAVSGGAPLSEPVAHRFLALGLPLLQGYGLTEAAPVVACNRLEDNLPASVGRPLPGVEVRLDQRGELLVRGPNVMLGYWNNPAATMDALDPEGWLHTGDLARIEDGRLFICGRLKDIIVMSTGEKVSPADMEAALTADALFEQALVVGEGRPFLAALLVLNPVGWKSLALALGIADPDDPASLVEPGALSAIRDKVNYLLARFPAWGRVRRVHLALAPWTVESGLLTPTMKPRRRELEERFAGEIAALYCRSPTGVSGGSVR